MRHLLLRSQCKTNGQSASLGTRRREEEVRARVEHEEEEEGGEGRNFFMSHAYYIL